MQINEKNIKDLKPEQIVWCLRGWFEIPRKGLFLGKFGVNYLFSVDEKVIKIYEERISENDYIKFKYLHTTYESVCEQFRIDCLNAIEHYNSHQLKNNPIVVK